MYNSALASIAFGRMGEPQEVGEVIAFSLSEVRSELPGKPWPPTAGRSLKVA